MLSAKTGISFAKILGMVLGFGLYKAKEELEPVANLLESAMSLATLKEEHEPPVETSPPENPEPEPVEVSSPDAGYIDLNLGFEGSGNGSDHVGERRPEPDASVPADDFLSTLS